MKGMFVVITAHADRAQIFHKRFAIPKSLYHKAFSPNHSHNVIILSEAKNLGSNWDRTLSEAGQRCFASLNMTGASQHDL
jgi:hypothetical protein